MPRRLIIFAGLFALVASGVVPARASTRASAAYLSGFPVLHQQRRLTCEASAASMATRARVVESRIMAQIPYDANPNLGFRGNPDKDQEPTLQDYGVYNIPVHRALLLSGYASDVILYGTDALLRSYIDRGWPVVVWVTYKLQQAVPRLGWSNGTQFFLVPHEHAVLVVGYDAAGVIVNEPWLQIRTRYAWGAFNRSWGYFARMALAVQPCAMPYPVSRLRPVDISSDSISWKWKPGTNDATYHVRVLTHGSSARVVLDQVQQANSVTVAAPAPNTSYEIEVTGVSVCGGTAPPMKLWTWTPYPSPTATPSEATPAPTQTARPSPTSTQQPTPTAGQTPK